MCVIFTAQPGVMPSMLELAQMADRNPDGAGIAWHDPETNTVKVRKFVDCNRMLGYIGTHYDELEDVAVLGHFRIATHGAINITNCHPFRVSCGVMAHNGVAGDYVHGPYSSDSRNAIRAWDADHSIDLKGQGRFALLTDDGDIDWIQGGVSLHRGIRVSNMLWRPSRPRREPMWGSHGGGTSEWGSYNGNVSEFRTLPAAGDTPTVASLASAGVTE